MWAPVEDPGQPRRQPERDGHGHLHPGNAAGRGEFNGDLCVRITGDPELALQITALVMLAEIGDITRFGSARKLASWAGLTPDGPRF